MKDENVNKSALTRVSHMDTFVNNMSKGVGIQYTPEQAQSVPSRLLAGVVQLGYIIPEKAQAKVINGLQKGEYSTVAAGLARMNGKIHKVRQGLQKKRKESNIEK